ncbi:hypothetical protein FOCC_FOCC004259 [Frankliniella occidentalis]|nr:hypothetical protein FOCC_FOCC004259 [Frankliniella occidentalis]
MEDTFSFRKLWAFTGPGFLISIAYLDPGNIEADLEAGSLAQYKLLWVVLWSSVAGLLLQRLAARLGAVTGLHMAEHAHRNYPAPVRILVWLMIELAIIGNDMQEYVVSAPPQLEVVKGALLPLCEGCGTQELLQIISLIGAIIAPHNLYLHSALVKSRDIDKANPVEVREANKYYFAETSIAVFIAYIINLFVIAVFGDGLYLTTNQEVRALCMANNNTHADIFPFVRKYVYRPPPPPEPVQMVYPLDQEPTLGDLHSSGSGTTVERSQERFP